MTEKEKMLAGSVVTRDIPAGTVAVGNPCKVVKKLGEKTNGEPTLGFCQQE